MDKKMEASEVEMVSCEICLKEVPVSEATTPEAMDYVAHFCGLECYQQWHKKGEIAAQQDDEAKSS